MYLTNGNACTDNEVHMFANVFSFHNSRLDFDSPYNGSRFNCIMLHRKMNNTSCHK